MKAISEVIGVTLRSTEYIRTKLVRRTNYVRMNTRKLKGGAKRAQFLSMIWTFKVPAQGVETIPDLCAENASLSKKVGVDRMLQRPFNSGILCFIL